MLKDKKLMDKILNGYHTYLKTDSLGQNLENNITNYIVWGTIFQKKNSNEKIPEDMILLGKKYQRTKPNKMHKKLNNLMSCYF